MSSLLFAIAVPATSCVFSEPHFEPWPQGGSPNTHARVLPTVANDPPLPRFRWLRRGLAQTADGATYRLDDFWLPSDKRAGPVIELHGIPEPVLVAVKNPWVDGNDSDEYRGGCGLWPGGEVRCWGFAQFGAIGPVCLAEASWTPRAIAIDEPVVRLLGGGTTICAETRSGRRYCWLARGTPQHREPDMPWAPEDSSRGRYDPPCAEYSLACRRPKEVPRQEWAQWMPTEPGEVGVVKIEGSTAGACVLTEDGTVTCYGFSPAYYMPIAPNGIEFDEVGRGPFSANAVDITVWAPGSLRACALLRDGHLRCWERSYSVGVPFTVTRAHLISTRHSSTTP